MAGKQMRSNHIEGVFNYCDRWCERCPFTGRCGNYALGQEIEEELQSGEDPHEISKQLFWKHLDDHCSLTQDEVEEADSVDLFPEPDITDFSGDFEDELQLEQDRDHEWAHTTREYIDRATAWLENAGIGYADDSKPLLPESVANSDTGVKEDASVDAIEVVLWYKLLIHTKLLRALSGLHGRFEDSSFEMEDANGSAKVALIGIDRSIHAWVLLLKAVPLMKSDTIYIISLLTGLRRRVEELLPEARAFMRPGFDTGET